MTAAQRRNFFLILILGALTTVSPFAIDMYLPAFQQIADDFSTTPAKVSLSISSYFIGLAFGQLMYGPVLDRYGRKRPLYFGLILFVIASVGCILSTSVETLSAWRLLQALGGCVAGVASTSMVRDFFPVKDSAKIFSLLMLILGVSPLFAPTLGSFITVTLGWQWVFIMLAAIAAIILAVVFFFLPEGHTPDPSISLKPKPILKGFIAIFKVPQFRVYVLSGSFAFSGLLAYVAGAPIIFMDIYGVSATTFGMIFAGLSIGFIGGNQVNILLLKRYTSEQIFLGAMIVESIIVAFFFAGTYLDLYNLPMTIAFLFAYFTSLSLVLPNTAALALAPFTRNVGSASALMGSLQIGVASFASAAIGFLNATSLTPIISILAFSSWAALAILLYGKRSIPVAAIPVDAL